MAPREPCQPLNKYASASTSVLQPPTTNTTPCTCRPWEEPVHGEQGEGMQQYLQRMQKVLAQTEEMRMHVAAAPRRGRRHRRLTFDGEEAAASPGSAATATSPSVGTPSPEAAACAPMHAGSAPAAARCLGMGSGNAQDAPVLSNEIMDSAATLSEWIRSATQSADSVLLDEATPDSPALPPGGSGSIFEWDEPAEQRGVSGIVRALSCGSPRDPSLPPNTRKHAERSAPQGRRRRWRQSGRMQAA